jgi:hypothetical protein
MTGNPKQLAEKGEAIYRQKYKDEYERLYPGKFVAIDLASQKAFVADTPEAAVELLQKEIPGSFFHLIKVGSPGVFKVGYSVHNDERDWLFQ